MRQGKMLHCHFISVAKQNALFGYTVMAIKEKKMPEQEKPLYHTHFQITIDVAVSVLDKIGKSIHRSGDWKDIEEVERKVLVGLLKMKGQPLRQLLIQAIIWNELADLTEGDDWETVLLGEDFKMSKALAPVLKEIGNNDISDSYWDEYDWGEGLQGCVKTQWLGAEIHQTK